MFYANDKHFFACKGGSRQVQTEYLLVSAWDKGKKLVAIIVLKKIAQSNF